MSNINLRLYADQVYGLSSSFLNKYLSPSIQKENFIDMFKNGSVKLEKINTKKTISIHPTISINDLFLGSLEVNVPDENTNLVINIQGLKSTLILSEIKEQDLEQIMISQRKKMKEKFIKNIFNKITKKNEGSSFIEGLIENVIKKIIKGLKISFKDIEILVKFEKVSFTVKINNLDLLIENKELKINFNGFSISYKHSDLNGIEPIEEDVIFKFDIMLNLIIYDEESNEKDGAKKPFCELKMETKNIKINLSRKVVKSVFDIINIFRDIKYNKLYYRFKKLIQFHRPKINEKNKNYKLLWQYAIRSIIKLKKFASFDDYNIFNLLNSTQKKIIKNEENLDNFLLPNDIYILDSTKNIVEKKILDSKNSLANKLFSFFSSKEEEKVLTDEEKEILEKYYKIDSLEKYLIKGKFEDDENNGNEIIKKIKKFLTNFEINLYIEKINIIFNDDIINCNNENKPKIFLTKFYLGIKVFDGKMSIAINAMDIGKNENESFGNQISNENKIINNDEKYLIKFLFDEIDNLHFIFEKEYIEIPDNILYLIICHSIYIAKSILGFRNRSIFHKKQIIKDKVKKNSVNEINIPYFPSLTLVTNDNKIKIIISEYTNTSELISFYIKIEDSFISILDKHLIKISIDEKNKIYNINLEKPLIINMYKKIIEQTIINFKDINNKIFPNDNIYKNNKLYNFIFSKYMNNISILKLLHNMNINIKDILFNLKVDIYENSIKIKNFNFQYENRNISLNVDEILLEIDSLSLISTFKEIKNIKFILQETIYNNKFNSIINEMIKSCKFNINSMKGRLYVNHKLTYFINEAIEIKGNKDINSETINCSFKEIKSDVYFQFKTRKLLNCKNMNIDIRINSNSDLAIRFNIPSPTIKITFIPNCRILTVLFKYFLKLKIIYEIKITNIKSEIFKTVLKDSEEKNEYDLSVNITNSEKIKENNQIDIINLEKFGLKYNLISYSNMFLNIKGNNFELFASQSDISYLFFFFLSPEPEAEVSDSSDSFSNIIKFLDLEVDLKDIKFGFYLENDYNKPIFDIGFNKFSLILNILRKKLINYNFKLNQFLINYYEDNINNNKNIPIPIINYEIDNKDENNDNNIIKLVNEEKNQIEIKKDNNNKININIGKLNILFKESIIYSIIYYFKDISIVELLYNKMNNKKEKKIVDNNKIENNIDLQILLSEIQFQFIIDYLNENNCFYLYLNQFDLAYIKTVNNSIKDNKLRMSLNNIIIKNSLRKILYTSNDYLLFVLNIKYNNSLSIICNSLFNKLIINLSHKDIILLYKIIFDFQQLLLNIFPNNQSISLKNEKIENDVNFKSTGIIVNIKSSSINENENNNFDKINNKYILDNIDSIVSEINIESINITLLEDDIINYGNMNNNYYYPFLNINLNKGMIDYELNNNTIENYPFSKFNSNCNLSLNYYNDIYKIWEPVTEDLIIRLDYILKKEKNNLVDNYNFEINKLILNISELFINTLLIKLDSWIYKLTNQIYFIKILKNHKKIKYNIPKENIVLKYIIYNYTDLNVNIKYNNKNYNINSNNKIDIKYNDDMEINNNLFKFINIIFNQKENSNNQISIYSEEFGLKKYKIILDNLERDIFIEIKMNKNKHIDIFIFNPIILKNKTKYSFNLHLNANENESKIINIQPYSITGLPINYILDKDTNFNFDLKDEKKLNIQNLLNAPLNLKDIIPNNLNEKISKDIFFKNNNISLSLISKSKIEKFTSIKISHKYCIINSLPCSLFIYQSIIDNKNIKNENDNKETIEIKKNSLYYIDDISFLTGHNSIKLAIKTNENYLHSKLSLDRNEEKKMLIKFTSDNNNVLILPILIQEINNIKTIIIYSEFILYNSCVLELNITSQDENKNNYSFNVGNNIYLISSDIKKSNSYICIKSSIFMITYIEFEQMNKEPYYEFSLNLENKSKNIILNYDLLINKSNSHLCCRNDRYNFINKINSELDMTTIYKIIPKYNIINNISKKNIKDNKGMNIILKKDKKYFMAINIKNIDEIKDKKKYYIFDNLTTNSLYTVCIGDNLYNVEVRKSKKGGHKNIFIFDKNLNHSQIIVENKTNYEIFIKQKKFEKNRQEIKKKETQILKIYEQTSQIFSVQIENKLYFLNLNEIGEKQMKNNLYLNIQQNKNSKKLIFFIKNLNDDNNEPKSKSVMELPKINNKNLNNNIYSDKYIKFNIFLNKINISLIGLNKIENLNNKNNRNEYERKEIVLLFLEDFQCGIKISKFNKQILPKNNNIYNIILNIRTSNCEIYNLLLNDKPSCLFANTSPQLINIYSEMNYDLDKNKITVFELVNEIGDIKLNISPTILQEMYNFFRNIILNVKFQKKIIDKIFLYKNINENNNINTINNNYKYHQFSIYIDKIDISGIKICFKLNKDGLNKLPKIIIDYINYFKCFPFFDIDKETKAILKKIYFQGPFKDIKNLFEKIKLNIITQLSTEIVIKVLHPSINEIKDNFNNIIGKNNKNIHKNDIDEIISRIKYKRIFLGRNKFYKRYDKNEQIIFYKLNDNLDIYKDKYLIDIINEKKWTIILFNDCFLYINNSDIIRIINYNIIKDINYEKNKIEIKYNANQVKDDLLELKDEVLSQKIYTYLIKLTKL